MALVILRPSANKHKESAMTTAKVFDIPAPSEVDRRDTSRTRSAGDGLISYRNAPARTINAGGVTYAYRELGPKGGIPVIFFVHLAATLDNWDPRIIDPIAKDHHVITFDNRGVGASSGQVPNSVEAMADDAYTFIRALGFDKVDIFSFSLGGFVAQALVVKHPDLVRKLVLTGTGPAGGKDIDKEPGPPT
jgi:pimeloyl-ACP methyl ester carboxylesterase